MNQFNTKGIHFKTPSPKGSFGGRGKWATPNSSQLTPEPSILAVQRPAAMDSHLAFQLLIKDL